MSNIVYVLINEAMPGYTKIGRTDNLEQRIRTLDNTSMPLPFECFYAAKVGNSVFVENQLHNAFADKRVRKNREFFEIAPERVVAALKLAQLEDVTPGQDFVESEDDQKALDKAKKIRAAFNFDIWDIPIGATLSFTRDPEVTCKVISSRQIEFNDEVTSLSAAATKALAELGFNWKSVQGPQYWVYENETLIERRFRMEQADS